eukprot:371639_1
MNYTPYLQNQSSTIPSNFIQSNITPTAIFASAIQALQNELFANVMTSLNMDKNRKENILLVSVCKLIDKIAMTDTLVHKFIDREEKSEDNVMYAIEKRLRNMEKLLKQNTSHKSMDTLENKFKNKILNMETQINSHTNILNDISKELKQLNAHNIEINNCKKQLNAHNINSHPMQC